MHYKLQPLKRGRLVLAASGFFFLVGLVGCTGTRDEDSLALESLTVPLMVTVDVGATVSLREAVKNARGRPPRGLAMSWMSADPSIATVTNEGMLTGVSQGDTTVESMIQRSQQSRMFSWPVRVEGRQAARTEGGPSMRADGGTSMERASGTPTGQEPANPHTTPTAQAVLQYLWQLPRQATKRLISGQVMDGASAPPLERIHVRFGKWVGIVGAEYSNWKPWPGPFPPNPPQRILWREKNPYLIDYWNKGGLVTLSWHPCSPRTGSFTDPGSDGPTSGESTWLNLDDLLVPGGQYYDYFKARLDEVVEGLRDLQAHGVVVIWRPLHGMDYDIGAPTPPFWWSGTPDRFKRIWRYVFDYLKARGVNNLLWLQDFYGESYTYGMTAYYAGDQYVDLIGLDINDYLFDKRELYDELSRLPKPFGFGEVREAIGPRNWFAYLEKITTSYPKASFFVAFAPPGADDGQGWGSINDGVNQQQMLEDPRIVNRGEFPWFAPWP